MPEREFGELNARMASVEREIEGMRRRMHDFESSNAALTYLTAAVKDLHQAIDDLPVTEERVRTLSAEVRNVKRALWSFTFAIVGGAITFAFVAIQLISQ